jgi:hypothetical protein
MADEDEVKTAYFRVLSDNFTLGEKGKRVSMPLTDNTAALVAGGTIEPVSAAAKELTESDG